MALPSDRSWARLSAGARRTSPSWHSPWRSCRPPPLTLSGAAGSASCMPPHIEPHTLRPARPHDSRLRRCGQVRHARSPRVAPARGAVRDQVASQQHARRAQDAARRDPPTLQVSAREPAAPPGLLLGHARPLPRLPADDRWQPRRSAPPIGRGARAHRAPAACCRRGVDSHRSARPHLARAATVVRDATRALVYLHTPTPTKGVVLHRDVKGANILLDGLLTPSLPTSSSPPNRTSCRAAARTSRPRR